MKRHAKWILLAAISSIPLLAPRPASAQLRVNDNNPGGALDANPRIGSGGSNAGGNYQIINAGIGYSRIPGNDIVTGNVRGLGYFHGGVPYAAASDFRGNLGSSQIDPFIARSTGSPAPNQSPWISVQPEQFHGNRTVQVPPGFVQDRSTHTWTPAPPSYLTPPQYTGVPIDASVLLTSPLMNEVPVPGPVDPQTGLPKMVTSSPLLGVRVWTREELDRAEKLLQSGNPVSEDLLKRLRLDRRTIDQMQEELNQSARPAAGAASLQSPQTIPRTLVDVDLTGKPLVGAVNPGTLTAGPSVSEGLSSRLVGNPLSRQSDQYKDLQKQFDRYYGVSERIENDEQRNRELRAQLRKLEDLKKKQAESGVLTPGTNLLPGQDVRSRIADEMIARTPMPGVRPAPTKITSLATGVKAQGLRNLLIKAEDLMKQGKFMSALDQYDAASAVTPGNTLVTLGKANAELGAGLYQRSAADLRRALSFDPVLTMAQFDLKAMMGQDRLETIVKDLKEVARKQENDATAPLLLGYVAYNTGNETQAGIYLDLAQKRAGGQDPFVKLLQTHWTLPVQGFTAPATTQPAR